MCKKTNALQCLITSAVSQLSCRNVQNIITKPGKLDHKICGTFSLLFLEWQHFKEKNREKVFLADHNDCPIICPTNEPARPSQSPHSAVVVCAVGHTNPDEVGTAHGGVPIQGS